jgi:hypothetical protein
MTVLQRLLAMHPDDNVLIIGQYLDQIERIAAVQHHVRSVLRHRDDPGR